MGRFDCICKCLYLIFQIDSIYAIMKKKIIICRLSNKLEFLYYSSPELTEGNQKYRYKTLFLRCWGHIL
jgi:hypothetical protein